MCVSSRARSTRGKRVRGVCGRRRGNPLAHEAVADHEQHGDQDDVRVAEAGERLFHRHDAGQRMRDQQDQSGGVEVGPVDREHDDRSGEESENEEERGQGGVLRRDRRSPVQARAGSQRAKEGACHAEECVLSTERLVALTGLIGVNDSRRSRRRAGGTFGLREGHVGLDRPTIDRVA